MFNAIFESIPLGYRLVSSCSILWVSQCFISGNGGDISNENSGSSKTINHCFKNISDHFLFKVGVSWAHSYNRIYVRMVHLHIF